MSFNIDLDFTSNLELIDIDNKDIIYNTKSINDIIDSIDNISDEYSLDDKNIIYSHELPSNDIINKNVYDNENVINYNNLNELENIYNSISTINKNILNINDNTLKDNIEVYNSNSSENIDNIQINNNTSDEFINSNIKESNLDTLNDIKTNDINDINNSAYNINTNHNDSYTNVGIYDNIINHKLSTNDNVNSSFLNKSDYKYETFNKLENINDEYFQSSSINESLFNNQSTISNSDVKSNIKDITQDIYNVKKYSDTTLEDSYPEFNKNIENLDNLIEQPYNEITNTLYDKKSKNFKDSNIEVSNISLLNSVNENINDVQESNNSITNNETNVNRNIYLLNRILHDLDEILIYDIVKYILLNLDISINMEVLKLKESNNNIYSSIPSEIRLHISEIMEYWIDKIDSYINLSIKR